MIDLQLDGRYELCIRDTSGGENWTPQEEEEDDVDGDGDKDFIDPHFLM